MKSVQINRYGGRESSLVSKSSSFFVINSSALDVRRRTVGEKHPNYAITLSNLGVLYSDIGDYHKAESHYLQALEIWRITVGENHRDYAQSLNILAELYRNQREYLKAEPLYVQALEIRRNIEQNWYL
jgi:tetratricopeptide (TPR) repeat protein